MSASSGVATAVGWLRSWLAGRRAVYAASGWLRFWLAARRIALCVPPGAGFAFSARLGFFRNVVREAAAAGRFRTAIGPQCGVRRTSEPIAWAKMAKESLRKTANGRPVSETVFRFPATVFRFQQPFFVSGKPSSFPATGGPEELRVETSAEDSNFSRTGRQFGAGVGLRGRSLF